MMLHVLCGYPSKSQGTYENWNQSDFHAYKFVKAIKGKPFNGYATVQQEGQNHRFESNEAGRATARRIATRALAGIIAKRLQLEEAAVVPVPASDHVRYGEPFTGSTLAEAIQGVYNRYQAYPNLTFSEPMQKASEGGPRDPAILLPYLRLHDELPELPLVLLDDVTSTHGHLKAAARRLRGQGYHVAGAICVAQTVWERPEKMFAIPAKDLNIDSWPGDHPGLFDL